MDHWIIGYIYIYRSLKRYKDKHMFKHGINTHVFKNISGDIHECSIGKSTLTQKIELF